MTNKRPITSDNKENKTSPVISTLLSIGKVLLIVLGIIVGVILLFLVALFVVCSTA